MMGDLGDTMKPVLVIDAKATEHILHSQTDALEALEVMGPHTFTDNEENA